MIEGKRLELWAGDQRLVIDRKKFAGVYQPPVQQIVARAQRSQVVLFINDRRLEMSTPIAVKVGLALCSNGNAWLEPDDVVLFEVSGVEILLLPEVAIHIGGVILKKADRADDWQRETVH